MKHTDLAAADLRRRHWDNVLEKKGGLTPEEHRQRHCDLHKALDEIAADFIAQHRGKRPGNTTLLELMDWSYKQTAKPTEGP